MGDYISMLEGRDGGLGPSLGAADAQQRLGLQPGAGSEAVQICNLFNELHTSGQQPAQPSMQQQLPPHLLPAGSVFQAAAATPPPQQQQALSALPLQRQGLQGGALPPLLPGHGPLVHLPHTLQRSQQNTPPLPGAAPALSAGGAHSGLDAPLCISPHMLHGGMPAAAAGPGGASASAKDAAAAARAARQRKRKEMAAAAAERAAAHAAAAVAGAGAGGGGSEGDDAGMAGLLLGEGSLGEGGLQESLEAGGSDERATRRMIKNRESAARSRARRQEYTASLESQVAQLRQQNRDLRVQVVLAAAAPADPHAGRLDGQLLRRTRTTPL